MKNIPCPDEDFFSLDDLFRDAMKVKQAEAKSRKNSPPIELPDPRAIWTNPENWRLGQVVALYHEDTQTLLGNFQEHLHIRVVGARRLTRVSGVSTSGSIEYVVGPQWIAPEQATTSSPEWTTVSELTMPVELPELGVKAEGVELNVHLYLNGITAVRLGQETTLTSPDGLTILTLPQDTNILPVLGHGYKAAIKTALEL